METSSIVRQIQIALITDTPHPVIGWLDHLWLELSSVTRNVYHTNENEILLYKEDIGMFWVLYYDPIDNEFQFDYRTFNVLYRMYDLQLFEIAMVIKLIIIEHRMNITSDPEWTTSRRAECIEEALERHYYAVNYKPGYNHGRI